MQFSIDKTIEILERTPKALQLLLQGLDDTWTMQNEGGETWSVYEVIAHLITAEKTNWLVRVELILSDEADKNFSTFKRVAEPEKSSPKTLAELLEEFIKIREENLEELRSKNITAEDLEKKGIHPVFGEVSLAQLLSTWTVHDLSHTAQITRIMAKQYKTEVGPWIEYLRILKA